MKRLLGIAALLGAGTVPAALEEAPTELERKLQGRYLDRYFLLRTDVQVLRLEAKSDVSLTWPARPPRESMRPSTFVTPEGIFYTRDYDDKLQLTTDVRVGVVIDGGQPGAATAGTDLMTQGGTVGNVVDLRQSPEVVHRKGDLVRVVGVEESPLGVQFTLEGFLGTAVPVLLRPGGSSGEPVPEETYTGLFGKLCYEMPEDRAERQARIDPGWPDEVVQAIQSEQVILGMTPLQVLLAWGTPVHVSQSQEGDSLRIWLYSRGATIRQQLQGGGTNVYFTAGRVVEVGGASLPPTTPR